MKRVYMTAIFIFIGVIALISFSLSLYSFMSTFRAFESKKIKDPYFIRKDVIGDKYYKKVLSSIKSYVKRPYRYVETKSFDNLTLRGNYYEFKKNAPLIIFFHGYKSNMYCDSAIGLSIAKELGYNLLTVSERAHGFSDGKVITFGIKERFDVLSWINFALDTFGKDVKIILYGISMGGSSVAMATSLCLPDNVKAICCDSTYSSPKEVIEEKIKSVMHLPKGLFYPFVYMGAFLFGHFNLGEMTSPKALKDNEIPILFLHGEKDEIAPITMARENYSVNKGEKKFVSFKTANHGLSFLEEPQKYKEEVKKFLTSSGY